MKTKAALDFSPDMIATLAQALEDATRSETPSLPFELLVQAGIYYPGAGFDGDLIKLFHRQTPSFIFTDYGVGADAVQAEIQTGGLLGYRPALAIAVSLDDCLQGYQETLNLIGAQSAALQPYAQWFVLAREGQFDDTHGPSLFSLLYLGVEGVAGYASLVRKAGRAPAAIALKDHGFGGNWTRFTAHDAPLHKIVKSDPPDHLIEFHRGRFCEACWPELYTTFDGAPVPNAWCVHKRPESIGAGAVGRMKRVQIVS